MHSMPADNFEQRIEEMLQSPDPPDDWQAVMLEMYHRYREQVRLLDRLTRISDRFQSAERERGQGCMVRYERQVRQLEKIVRISDQYQNMLRDLKDRLEHAADYDALTSLPNRRYMMRRMEEAAAEARRIPERTFSLMLADIDHFKAINDGFGHSVGDQVLRAIAQAMKSVLREYDICARWGGEEFLLMFPGCFEDSAAVVAERLLKAVATASLPEERIVNPTISIGYTLHRSGEHTDETVRRADQALYRAKDKGRNCAVCI
jgi:diguanylate cyclase (GGDEF)-like protein